MLSMAEVSDRRKVACNRGCVCSDCRSEGGKQARRAAVGRRDLLNPLLKSKPGNLMEDFKL